MLNNKQFMQIRAAAKRGDEKALAIMDKFVHNGSDDDIGRMCHDYFCPSESPVSDVDDQTPDPEGMAAVAQNEATNDAPSAAGPDAGPAPIEPADISGDLDKELEGLIDEDEVKDSTFDDFLKKKHRDAVRAKKNRDYFSAFDPLGKASYLENKKSAYSDSFNTRRSDIDRAFRDMDRALSMYSQSVSDLPGDSMQLSPEGTDGAYGAIVESGQGSHAFGRSWDPDDMAVVTDVLKGLVAQYGKKNVLAALNVIKGDNSAFRDYRSSQIDTAVGDYGKALDKLLK